MGLLVNGQWQDQWYDTKSTGGRFVRKDAAFRNWVTADGTAGPRAKASFKAEAGRYHLYVSLACPWAHRTFVKNRARDMHQVSTAADPRDTGRVTVAVLWDKKEWTIVNNKSSEII